MLQFICEVVLCKGSLWWSLRFAVCLVDKLVDKLVVMGIVGVDTRVVLAAKAGRKRSLLTGKKWTLKCGLLKKPRVTIFSK